MENTLTRNRIPTTDTFGARLALIRHDMQWNLKEASIECGFTLNQWANWEAGRAPRGYQDVCEKISKRTGIDLIWLMMGAQSRPSDYKAQISTRTRPPRGPSAKLSRPKARI